MPVSEIFLNVPVRMSLERLATDAETGVQKTSLHQCGQASRKLWGGPKQNKEQKKVNLLFLFELGCLSSVPRHQNSWFSWDFILWHCLK